MRPPALPPPRSRPRSRRSPRPSTRMSTNSAASTRSPATETTASACSADRTPLATRPSPLGMPEPERRRCSLAPPTHGRIAPAAPPVRCGASSSPRWPPSSATRGGRAPPTSPRESRRGAQGVMDYGKAEVGDKTLVDALVPFSGELTGSIDAGASLAAAWATAADAATRAAASTADLLPRMGRARPHAREEPRHPGPRRALARPHRHGRRRRLRKELTWHTPSRCAS